MSSPPADDALRAQAIATATQVLEAAAADTTRRERAHAQRLGRLLADPDGRELLFTLTDEILRTTDDARAMRRLRTLVDAGLPRALSFSDRAGLRLAAVAGARAPRAVAAAVRRRVRTETRGVILPATDPAFARHLAQRRSEGFDANVNLLGEAILGDDEAAARLDAVLALIRRPDVRCVSVKISALCANLDVLAFDHEVARIEAQLRVVFRAAQARNPATFVYLDMEEYRDLHLTAAAFRTVLAEPEFRDVLAGVALQAYLPDSFPVLDELCAYATERRAAGGTPIRVRIVKGANLAMESVEAEMSGWPLAPYDNKPDVDANYKRMLQRAVVAAERGDIHIGVASQNLFDVAWGLAARDAHGLGERLEVEMLEGMAPAQARATRATAGELLLYTPVVDEADFSAAIAYLSRRLDENAAEENFLRALFSLRAGSPRWREEQRRFETALSRRDDVSSMPHRTQDRRTERRHFDADAPFTNEPDTDFVLPANREWIAHHLATDVPAPLPPLLTTVDAIDAVVARARRGASTWAATTTADRRAILCRAAEHMAASRGRTIAVMAIETAKTVREGDVEVSEAIDMARWAANQTRQLEALGRDGTHASPFGVVLVASPWNFPYAITANGVCSALAAGNAVLCKPAPEAVATAVELVRHLHEAGVPDDVVQLVRCPDDDVGRALVTHDGIDTVVLTGAYDTAQMFLEWKPRMRLLAETSGKNALVVTGGADVDLAIRDAVRSAFGHAGQKCSAASLLVVDAAVHDDGAFLGRLADATRSVRVGAATDLATMTGPLVQPANGKLRRALTQLDPGEHWLVEPVALDEEGRLWRPGVKLGVQPGSWFHRTECFGPVLGVLRSRGLDDAIALQNGVEFGLTAGLHSLDPDEITHWADRVEAGNLYVNRHTTGAIVQRQPFGGWKHSSVGPGAKTGGPHDIFRFVRFATATEASALDPAAISPSDPSGLRAESNVLRYRALDKVVVRAGPATTAVELGIVADASIVSGTSYELAQDESDDDLARRIASSGAQRLRALVPINDALARSCHRAGIVVDDTAITNAPDVELARWTREQAISRTMHRHGRVSRA